MSLGGAIPKSGHLLGSDVVSLHNVVQGKLPTCSQLCKNWFEEFSWFVFVLVQSQSSEHF